MVQKKKFNKGRTKKSKGSGNKKGNFGGKSGKGPPKPAVRTTCIPFFHNACLTYMGTFLTKDEMENLGKVDSRFRKTNQQKKREKRMQMMHQRRMEWMKKQQKIQEDKKRKELEKKLRAEGKELPKEEDKDGNDNNEKKEEEEEDNKTPLYGEEETETPKDNKTDNDKKKKEGTTETTNLTTKEGETTTKEGEDSKEDDDEETKKRKKKEEEEMQKKKKKKSYMIPDPDTLLARLNTRRLYKRIKYLKQHVKNYKRLDPNLPYPRNLSTRDIADFEWDEVVRKATIEMNQYEGYDKLYYLPSPYELLLFTPCPRAVTVLASYPRSGNSLMRNLYERVTMRVTGSDMRGGLTQHDLVGEAATDNNSVQFVKTHYPERIGTPRFPCSRVVLLVRNPFDAIDSYFNLMTTNTHTTSLTEEQRKESLQEFSQMVLKEIQVWRQFHHYWIQQRIPILMVRYEDLIRYTDKVLSRVIAFVLEVDDMTFFESRINRCVNDSVDKVGAYKPRSGGIGKSMKWYTPETYNAIIARIKTHLCQLGYEDCAASSDPNTWKIKSVPTYAYEMKNQEGRIVEVNGGPHFRPPQLQTKFGLIRKKLGMEKIKHKDSLSNPYNQEPDDDDSDDDDEKNKDNNNSSSSSDDSSDDDDDKDETENNNEEEDETENNEDGTSEEGNSEEISTNKKAVEKKSIVATTTTTNSNYNEEKKENEVKQ